MKRESKIGFVLSRSKTSAFWPKMDFWPLKYFARRASSETSGFSPRSFIVCAQVLALFFTGNVSISAGDKEPVNIAFLGLNQEAIYSGAGLQTKISLDLRNIDVIDAMKFLSMKSGLNIVPTQRVTGKVTLKVDNVPVKDIFDIMLRSNSLAYDKKGDIYNIMTEAEYKALYGKSFFDSRQVKVFRLNYAVPAQAFSLLDAVKSDIGRLLVEPESGTVMIMDTPEKIEEAQKMLASIEHKGSIKVFTLKYARAKDMEEQLKNQLDAKKVGTVRADDRNNQVIVQTLPERMKDIENLILSLDKKTKEVLIDVKILQVTLSNQVDKEIQWEGIFGFLQKAGLAYLGSYPFSAVQASSAAFRTRSQVLKDLGDTAGSYPFSGTTSNLSASQKVAPGQNLHIGMINNKNDFDILIKYLQTMGKTKVISNPSLAAVNNQEAKIMVGEHQAYVTTTTSAGSAINTVSESVNFVDVGMQLGITPTIHDGGYVTMKIKPEISSVSSTLITTSNNRIPIISTSTLETTVMAKDGSTIILAGLSRLEKSSSSQGVPFLSKIPLLGNLFRSSSNSVSRQELLVLLTPYIFEGNSLITPTDREKDSHGIKKTKNFDVFKIDKQAENIQQVSQEVSQESVSSKGLKTYQGKVSSGGNLLSGADKAVFLEETQAVKSTDAQSKNEPASVEIVSGQEAASEKEEFTAKGFKEYSDTVRERLRGIGKDMAGEIKFPVPTKGLRTENNF